MFRGSLIHRNRYFDGARFVVEQHGNTLSSRAAVLLYRQGVLYDLKLVLYHHVRCGCAMPLFAECLYFHNKGSSTHSVPNIADAGGRLDYFLAMHSIECTFVVPEGAK